MNDAEFLARALDFWQKLANGTPPSEDLRNEFVQLLSAFRAQGMLDAARVVRRARRGMLGEGADPVARYVLAQIEEELRREAHGLPPRDPNAQWLRETPS
jgi:hypothetical protein